MGERIFEGRGFCFPLGKRTYCMGVLNVTPDSFSDGGMYLDTDAAVRHALEMERDGADVIDVGAESTRPGHAPVSAAEEIERLRGVLPALCERLRVPVSVDTRHVETAKWALEHGAHIINDVSSVLTPDMASLVREHRAGWIVMHGADADSAPAGDPVPRVRRFFDYAADFAVSAGLPLSQMCFDPGIGFGKSRNGDFAVLRKLDTLTGGYALLVGASRKRLIGTASGEADAMKRLPGTIACHTAAIAGGADFIRVHDVAEAVQAMRVADAVYRVPRAAQTGQIQLRGLRVFACHGVNPEEKEFGQSFFIDLDMTTDFTAAVQGDDIGDTVSYAKVAKTLTKTLTEQRFDLIEKAAEAAADAVLRDYPAVQKLRLRIKKPDAPMKAECAFAAVEIEKERDV